MPTDKVPTVTRLTPAPRGNGVSASIRWSGGWMDGMGNTWERWIHVERRNRPKMLRGLGQKALERVQGLAITLSWTPNATGGQRAPHPSLSIVRNVVSPYRSSRKEGREAVRRTKGGAGKGAGKSECPPVMGGIRVATSPGGEAGRLTRGVP